MDFVIGMGMVESKRDHNTAFAQWMSLAFLNQE